MIIQIILALLLPPLSVLLQKGVGKQLVINIILTILGWLPGVVHALYLIAQDKKAV